MHVSEDPWQCLVSVMKDYTVWLVPDGAEMVSGGHTDRSLICAGVKKIHRQEQFELSFVSRTAGEKRKTSIHHQYFWGTTSSITSRASHRVIFCWRGRFRVYWGFCPDNPSGGEWGERDEEGTSLPRAPRMPALTFEPWCARNLKLEVATSRPPFWTAECLTPFSQKVKQFAPVPDDLSPPLVLLRYESTLTSVAFISSACY